MPVYRTQLYAEAHFVCRIMVVHLADCPSKRDQASQQVKPVQSRDQVEEAARWAGRQEVTGGDQLSPSQNLPNEESNCGHPSSEQAGSNAIHVSPLRGVSRPLQPSTAKDQHARVYPQDGRLEERPPVR